MITLLFVRFNNLQIITIIDSFFSLKNIFYIHHLLFNAPLLCDTNNYCCKSLMSIANLFSKSSIIIRRRGKKTIIKLFICYYLWAERLRNNYGDYGDNLFAKLHAIRWVCYLTNEIKNYDFTILTFNTLVAAAVSCQMNRFFFTKDFV